jgi:hypothetical protein
MERIHAAITEGIQATCETALSSSNSSMSNGQGAVLHGAAVGSAEQPEPCCFFVAFDVSDPLLCAQPGSICKFTHRGCDEVAGGGWHVGGPQAARQEGGRCCGA